MECVGYFSALYGPTTLAEYALRRPFSRLNASEQMDHILVVDDDPNIRDLLRDYLQGMGFGVFVATGSAQMKQIIGTSRIDMVVLDLTLDGEDGLDVARDLRRRNTVPIIMLSARGALLDRIIGLEMGADDYLPKPFDPRELLAKIRSVLRRTRNAPAPRIPEPSAHVSFAGWRLDTATKQMLSPDGVMITLGGSDYRTLRTLLDNPNRPLSRDYLPKPFDPRELLAKIRSVLRRTRSAPALRVTEPSARVSFAGWRLDTATKQMLSPEGVMITLGGSDYRTLRTLLDNPNRPLSRDYLLDEVFGKEGTPLDRSIDVCISRLRQHLKDTARQPKLIRTVRHEGYMLTANVAHESHE